MAADVGNDNDLHSGREKKQNFSGAALGYNTRTEEELRHVFALVEKAGGTVVKPPQRAFWGGFQGYFTDTEGNLWEVAHNPDFPISEDGAISLPD